MIADNFAKRHLGPGPEDVKKMLAVMGVGSLDELIDQTIPASIRMEKPLVLPEGMNEYEYLEHMKGIASRNEIFRTFIGLGYYGTIIPAVILRNVFENPGWYTSYTPYQAEISQGRLEALLNFQTLVSDLTGLPIANASLLDEGTAAAEAMIMFYNARSSAQVKQGVNKFFAAGNLFPQTLEVIRTRSGPLNIEVVSGPPKEFTPDEKYFGAILQYPDQQGAVADYSGFVRVAHEKGIPVAVAADLLSLALLAPPGEWAADVALGSSQRFGIPMGYGGPHAAYFSTTEKYKRFIPGRIIGVSQDANGNVALRMALQTREQHIKRERATSNICTAQALLASMAGFYAVYHGPEGIRQIASDIHKLACLLAAEIENLGFAELNKSFFDTLCIELPMHVSKDAIRRRALEHRFNFRYFENNRIGISLDETTTVGEVRQMLKIFAEAAGKPFSDFQDTDPASTIPISLRRTSGYLAHPVFNTCHSETEMMRYLKKLENRDLALNRCMIPLGSCTMKLNAAAEMIPLSWPEFHTIHPFAPADQARGYQELISRLEKDLCEITGFSAVSFQPNSGAAGEYTGLLVIRKYLKDHGQGSRNVCLIPSSAHGTNPASSVMAGMEVVVVNCDSNGNIDVTDLREKAERLSSRLAALMVTYPSTHGVFEEKIREVIEVIHSNGGLVYMDGANMNAQVGLTNPAIINADVCHLNLHKTFAIPHGGGGPGVGPICVAKHLVPYLPSHPLQKTGGEKGISSVSSAPFGSALILAISYAYIKLCGGEGLTEATRYAILNANYLKSRLEGHYKILYTGDNGRVAHEMILDCNSFMKAAGIAVVDIAKRLMDYGFHAPTVAFPVHGTLMVEPTESEPLAELDRLADALIAIRNEIAEVEEGKADKLDNVIKNAPHTLSMIMNEAWNHPYSKNKAALPSSASPADKYWTPVTRIDDAYGDRNLVCTCPEIKEYLH
jgi:glycine dehydrogenase